MGRVGEYVFSVCGAGLLCAVLAPFLHKSRISGIGKLVTGIFLLLSILRPLNGLVIDYPNQFFEDFQMQAQQAVCTGEDNAYLSLSEIIKDRTAAYILQKADVLGLQIEVEVEVSGDTIPFPEAVIIHGEAAPYARQQLQDTIRRDLGIERENQIWT